MYPMDPERHSHRREYGEPETCSQRMEYEEPERYSRRRVYGEPETCSQWMEYEEPSSGQWDDGLEKRDNGQAMAREPYSEYSSMWRTRDSGEECGASSAMSYIMDPSPIDCSKDSLRGSGSPFSPDTDGDVDEELSVDLEILRKRMELEIIEEQIACKKAALAMELVGPESKAIRQQKTKDNDLEMLITNVSNKDVTLKERVNSILRKRAWTNECRSKVAADQQVPPKLVLHPPKVVKSFVERMNESILHKDSIVKDILTLDVHEEEHPLKLKVEALLEQRRNPTVNKEDKAAKGFQYFLNVLNKGVDIDRLSKIVNNFNDLPSVGEELPQGQPPPLDGQPETTSKSERKVPSRKRRSRFDELPLGWFNILWGQPTLLGVQPNPFGDLLHKVVPTGSVLPLDHSLLQSGEGEIGQHSLSLGFIQAKDCPKNKKPKFTQVEEKRKGRHTSKSPPVEEKRKGRHKSKSPPVEEKRKGRHKSKSPPVEEKRKGRHKSMSPPVEEKRKERHKSMSPPVEEKRKERHKSMSPPVEEKRKERHKSMSPPVEEKRKGRHKSKSPPVEEKRKERHKFKSPPVEEKRKERHKSMSPPVEEKRKERHKSMSPPVEEKRKERHKSMSPPVEEKRKERHKSMSPPVEEKRKERHKSMSPPVEEKRKERHKSMSPPVEEKRKERHKSKSPQVEEKRKMRPEDEQRYRQIQSVLQTIGLDLGVEELGRLNDRTQERLYGKKRDQEKKGGKKESMWEVEKEESEKDKQKEEEERACSSKCHRISLLSDSSNSSPPCHRWTAEYKCSSTRDQDRERDGSRSERDRRSSTRDQDRERDGSRCSSTRDQDRERDGGRSERNKGRSERNRDRRSSTRDQDRERDGSRSERNREKDGRSSTKDQDRERDGSRSERDRRSSTRDQDRERDGGRSERNKGRSERNRDRRSSTRDQDRERDRGRSERNREKDGRSSTKDQDRERDGSRSERDRRSSTRDQDRERDGGRSERNNGRSERNRDRRSSTRDQDRARDRDGGRSESDRDRHSSTRDQDRARDRDGGRSERNRERYRGRSERNRERYGGRSERNRERERDRRSSTRDQDRERDWGRSERNRERDRHSSTRELDRYRWWETDRKIHSSTRDGDREWDRSRSERDRHRLSSTRDGFEKDGDRDRSERDMDRERWWEQGKDWDGDKESFMGFYPYSNDPTHPHASLMATNPVQYSQDMSYHSSHYASTFPPGCGFPPGTMFPGTVPPGTLPHGNMPLLSNPLGYPLYPNCPPYYYNGTSETFFQLYTQATGNPQFTDMDVQVRDPDPSLSIPEQDIETVWPRLVHPSINQDSKAAKRNLKRQRYMINLSLRKNIQELRPLKETPQVAAREPLSEPGTKKEGEAVIEGEKLHSVVPPVATKDFEAPSRTGSQNRKWRKGNTLEEKGGMFHQGLSRVNQTYMTRWKLRLAEAVAKGRVVPSEPEPKTEPEAEDKSLTEWQSLFADAVGNVAATDLFALSEPDAEKKPDWETEQKRTDEEMKAKLKKKLGEFNLKMKQKSTHLKEAPTEAPTEAPI